jgi:polysaccharide biosynthesis protein PslG
LNPLKGPVDRRRVTLVVALVASVALVVGLSVSLLGGVGTSSSETATIHRQEFFGIAQGITRLKDKDLETMAKTGVGTDRFLLDWALVEPTQGSFNWPDEGIGALASHGIRPVPYVWGSPAWVAATPPRPPLDSASDEQAWQDFLQAAVARYGPGGSYWTHEYQQQFGDAAKPLPIQSWQIWNEPNLEKYFAPKPSAEEYARLLAISHDAVKSQDPQARIVLAGMPGFGKPKAWDFLDSLYEIPGTERDFDAAALHPYASTVDELGSEIQQFRASMTSHGEGSTPLWLTEIAWGSASPDKFKLNKGIPGQAHLMGGAFSLILNRRSSSNVRRVFWFDWRDPKPGSVVAKACSFCGSAGLLNYKSVPKPSYKIFKFFASGQ